MAVKRGAAINPGNPFERFHIEEDPAAVEELRRIDPEWEPPALKTAFFTDDTQSSWVTKIIKDPEFRSPVIRT